MQNQLDAADLQRQRQQLDAREEALATKEKVFNQALLDTDITALEETKRVREAQLLKIQEKINLAEKASEERKKQLQLAEKKILSAIEVAKNNLEALNLKIQEGTVKHAQLLKQLASVKQDISDAKTNYRELEKTTQNAINDWNDQLRTFANELTIEHDKKTSILRENQQLEGYREDLNTSINETTQKLEVLDVRYNERAAELKEILSGLASQVQAANMEIKALHQEKKKYLESLDLRIKEVEIKERALQNREKEVNLKERQLEAQLGYL